MPSRELPTASLTTIQPTSNIAIPVYRSVTPSEELPTESLTTIHPTSNISSLPGPHTPAYTQPMKHLKPAHTDVYRPVVEAITPVKKESASKVKKIQASKSIVLSIIPPYLNIQIGTVLDVLGSGTQVSIFCKNVSKSR